MSTIRRRTSAHSSFPRETAMPKKKSIPGADRPPPPEDEQLHFIYDSVAKRWGRDEPWVRDELIAWEWILDKARRLSSNGTILDCGCGTGNYCRPLSECANRVIGIDSSTQMIEEAVRRNEGRQNVEYIVGDMRNLGTVVEEGTVDLCLSIFGFCCLPSLYDVRAFLRAMRKALRSGGHAIIQIPHPLDGFYDTKSAWIRERGRPTSYFDSGVTIQRELRTVSGDWLPVGRHHYTLSEYLNAFVNAKFRLIETREPFPDVSTLAKHPDLLPESRLPSSMVFVCDTIE